MINTSGKSTVVADSDALIGIINDQDALHERCVNISQFLSEVGFETLVTYPIVLEAATVLAKDKTIKRPDLAAKLLKEYRSIEEKGNYNLKVSGLVSKLYDPETSRKNSPFDHYVLSLAKKNKIKYVFSFDSFYKKYGLILAEELINKFSKH